jgi:hypothetical protein
MANKARARNRARALQEQAKAADPVRNPVTVMPATDPEYPAITGPVELPPTIPADGLNPSEVFAEGAGPGSTGKPGRVEVGVRKRPGRSTLEP